MSKLSRVQSADLAVLSSDDWSSSSSGSSTSSIATVEGGGGPLDRDPSSSFWLGDIIPKYHNKHSQDGQSNPSPKSTDTAWISNSSVGLLIGEGESDEQPLQQQQTPLAAWVDQQALGSGWEQVRPSRDNNHSSSSSCGAPTQRFFFGAHMISDDKKLCAAAEQLHFQQLFPGGICEEEAARSPPKPCNR